MDLTKIFSGMDKGPEAIQANFEKINSAVGDKVSSQSIQVTFINGFSGDISMRIYQLGSNRITTIEGWFNTGNATLKGGTTTGIFKVPAGTDIGMVFAWTNSSNMLNGRVHVKADGTVTVELENDLGPNNFVDLLGMRAY
nr:MAG TPA: baseplate protein [Caudoviricetes sp.]